MIEWIVACILLLALVVLVGRRGYRHLLGRRLPWAIVLLGGAAGWMLEALPFTEWRATPSMLSAIAAGCGLFGARLVARGVAGWARGMERDLAAGAAPATTGVGARMVHPLIGAGLWLFGAALLYILVAMRHETLESRGAPRDRETGVRLGAEDRRLEPDAPTGRAALLVHGFNGSPSDFGDLPEALRAAGFAVRVLRLPGHGTIPAALDSVATSDHATAVEEARAELEKTHADVTLVGFSYGGALAVRSAAARAPRRLVLVNPWVGDAVRPWGCPFSVDSLMEVGGAITTRVIRPPGMRRINDPEGAARHVSNATFRTKAAAEARDFARAAGTPETVAKLTAPTLVVLSSTDRTSAPERTEAWFVALPLADTSKRLVRFELSDHVILHDYDRAAAAAAIVEFLR